MEKRKFKFNLVDAIIVLIIVAAIAFVGFKFFAGNVNSTTLTKYKISFFCDDVPAFAAQVIKEGDLVTDDDKSSNLGIVETVTLGPSNTFAATRDGEYRIAPKEGCNSVEVVAIVDAQEFQHGIKVNAAKYGIGHSLTLRVGKAKIFGRVSGLEKID